MTSAAEGIRNVNQASCNRPCDVTAIEDDNGTPEDCVTLNRCRKRNTGHF